MIKRKPFAWSYSALTRFETCPKQYYHLNVLKDYADADSDAAREGKEIHDALYKRVIKGTPLPFALRPMESVAVKFAESEGEKIGEVRVALNRDFEPVDFFAKDAWVRGVFDLLIIRGELGVLVDWKTGRPKEDVTQLLLMAAIAFGYAKELQTIKTAFVWTKNRSITPKTVRRDDVRRIWALILPRVEAMETAYKTTEFPANPNGLCRDYCPVRSCPHNGG